MIGWTCPGCGKSYGPWVQSCACQQWLYVTTTPHTLPPVPSQPTTGDPLPPLRWTITAHVTLEARIIEEEA